MATTKAQQKATIKYMKNNYDNITLRVKKGQKDILKNHAESIDESLSGFIHRAIYETMERDKEKQEQDNNKI